MNYSDIRIATLSAFSLQPLYFGWEFLT